MDLNEFSTERHQRYEKDTVIAAIKPLLAHVSPTARAELVALAERIRQHPMPYFWVKPSTKWVDLVKADARDGRA